MLVQVMLGSEAIAYVRKSLSRSSNTLTAYLQRLPLEAGSVFTFALADSDRAKFTQFEHSVVPGSSSTEIIPLAQAYLAQPGPRTLVFEDTLARAGDSGLSGTQAHYLTHGQEVYYIVTKETASAEAIERLIDYAQGYPTNGIFTSGVSLAAYAQGAAVGEDTLEQLAASTEYVLARAYDNLGFVIWSRTPPDLHDLHTKCQLQSP